jgi:hypothetical protein
VLDLSSEDGMRIMVDRFFGQLQDIRKWFARYGFLSFIFGTILALLTFIVLFAPVILYEIAVEFKQDYDETFKVKVEG